MKITVRWRAGAAGLRAGRFRRPEPSATATTATTTTTTRRAAPLVIGHRGGGSGYLPEHTLEAYALGIELGADYVEPDLVATKDGHLIARHEPNLIDTTNVKDLPQFAARKPHGDARRRARRPASSPATSRSPRSSSCAPCSRCGERDPRFDGKFQIPTLDEVIEFVKRKSAEKGRAHRHLSRDQAPDLPPAARPAAGRPAAARC